MAPKSKDARTRFLEPLATDVAAFRAAVGMGTTEIGVIREAVREFIHERIKKDASLRKKFDAEKKRILAEKIQPLRLVKNGSESDA